MLDAHEFIARWPHASAVKDSAVTRTGLAGRPSGRALVEQEAQRRRDVGETIRTLKDEAAALANWYEAEKRPNDPRMVATSIENAIHDKHRAYVGNPDPTKFKISWAIRGDFFVATRRSMFA